MWPLRALFGSVPDLEQRLFQPLEQAKVAELQAHFPEPKGFEFVAPFDFEIILTVPDPLQLDHFRNLQIPVKNPATQHPD